MVKYCPYEKRYCKYYRDDGRGCGWVYDKYKDGEVAKHLKEDRNYYKKGCIPEKIRWWFGNMIYYRILAKILATLVTVLICAVGIRLIMLLFS